MAVGQDHGCGIGQDGGLQYFTRMDWGRGKGTHGHDIFHTKEGEMADFLFVLSKDNNEAATRCFQFAKIAHGKGHKVNLFFIDGGVNWADKSRDLTIKTATGDCPLDYLPYLVENYVPIGV
jgi:hypothetical protein